MSRQSTIQSGFSAVELLITLFIAAAFAATGYQLYSIILSDSGEARTRASASNIAYTALRRHSPQTTNPCTVVTPTPTPTIPSGSGLSNASISVVVTCPFGTTSGTSKITATVTYGPSAEVIQHALYVSN